MPQMTQKRFRNHRPTRACTAKRRRAPKYTGTHQFWYQELEHGRYRDARGVFAMIPDEEVVIPDGEGGTKTVMAQHPAEPVGMMWREGNRWLGASINGGGFVTHSKAKAVAVELKRVGL